MQALTAMLWPWLGERRKERVAEVIQGCNKPTRRPRREYVLKKGQT